MARPGSERNPTIESLKERIARDPLSRAFLQLAEEYRKEGRYQEAVQVCLEGLERHPTYHTARLSLGRTHMEAGDLAAARRAFSEVLDLQPENHLAGKLLAEVQKKTSDLAGAADTYRTILRYYPNDREVQGLLSEALRGSAVASTATAQGIPPAPPKTPASPGPAAMPPFRPPDPAPDYRAGDLDGAGLAVGETAVSRAGPWEADPAEVAQEHRAREGDDALQTNTLAELYLRQGLVDRAVEVYRAMLRVDPANQKAARRLADLLPGGAGPLPAASSSTAAMRLERPAPVAKARLEQAAAMASASPGPASPAAGESKAGPGERGRDERILRLERWLEGIRAGSAREASAR
jgi:tetratricopeptide (TPR) repeat protein